MKWEILIVSLPSRAEFLSQLLSVLEPQILALPLRKYGDVHISIHMDYSPGMETIGEKRESLRQKSQGDYINFVDDDDLISPHYVDRILPRLDGTVDQIGFRLSGCYNWEPLRPISHSLRHGDWFENSLGYFRDISHMCPMRRSLAMQVPMSGGFGEDYRWATAMRGKVQSEFFVDEILYYYLWREPKLDATDPRHPLRLELLESLRAKG